MFSARSASPYLSLGVFHHPLIDQAVEGVTTLFSTPPGYFLADGLGNSLCTHYRPTLWLRVNASDRDPAAFLLSLAGAAQRLSPGVGLKTMEEMQRRPGPVFGWPPLFATLARELSTALPENSAYGLNPEIFLWIDVDEFDRHLRASRQFEAAGQLESALGELEVAASLYQGDFLAEDPYEEWSVLTRERLRLAYLGLLDRLSHSYFERDQYTACTALCQQILTYDNCSEEAHCLLMRSYCRQGQHHMALRQYQACSETLRTELQVEPARTTTQWCLPSTMVRSFIHTNVTGLTSA